MLLIDKHYTNSLLYTSFIQHIMEDNIHNMAFKKHQQQLLANTATTPKPKEISQMNLYASIVNTPKPTAPAQQPMTNIQLLHIIGWSGMPLSQLQNFHTITNNTWEQTLKSEKNCVHEISCILKCVRMILIMLQFYILNCHCVIMC